MTSVLVESQICPNCGSRQCVSRFSVTVSSDHISTQLTHCLSCDFLFLPNPEWLDAAYRKQFYGDTGYVQRNLANATFLKRLLLVRDFLCPKNPFASACDFGTGLGMLPRLMRDQGYDFWGTDEYSEMPLIRPFINPSCKLDLITAFEVVEHVSSLPALIDRFASAPSLLVFSTELREVGSVPPSDWWYYAFSVGQHISFHSLKSLAKASRLSRFSSVQFLSDRKSLHAFAFDESWARAWKLTLRIQSHRFAGFFWRWLASRYSRTSLTWDDHVYAMRCLDA